MRFDLRQLKKMSVETELGMRLGKVFNIIFDTEGQNVSQYEVGSYFNKNQYLVSRDQVIKFTENKMIVNDNVKKVGIDEKNKKEMRVSAEPALMREDSN